MKRNVALLTIVFSSLILLYAQDNKVEEMTGWICNSACVTQSAGKSTCDATCKDKSGDAVFVDDQQGKVSKITNQNIVKGKMGQKVKVKCNWKDKESMEILQIIYANAG